MCQKIICKKLNQRCAKILQIFGSEVRIPADYCSLTDKRKKPECLSNTKTEGSAKQDKIKEYQHELEQEKYNTNQKLCEIDQELRFNLNNRRLVIL